MSASYIPAPGSLLEGLEGPDAAGLREVEALITSDNFRSESSDLPDFTDTAVDPIQKYLNEISAIPLLSPEDEKALAERVRQGVEARCRLEQNDFQGEEAELLRQLDARGKLAGRLLFQANLRFVVSIAKQYSNQGLSLEDLINDGNLGLIKAAHRFDEKRGYKFISYAVWWIRQAMLQSLAEHSRIVRLPLNRAGTLYKIGKVQPS